MRHTTHDLSRTAWLRTWAAGTLTVAAVTLPVFLAFQCGARPPVEYLKPYSASEEQARRAQANRDNPPASRPTTLAACGTEQGD